MFFDHSRKMRHIRAPHNFGGVGCFTRNNFAKDFKICHDKTYEGIQVLKFTHKTSQYNFLVINVYLPPFNSVYGRDATGFMAHLLTLVYLNTDCDAMYIVGDLNARLGNMYDFIKNVDNIQERTIIDNVCNSHGEALIDFLLESKMVVVNGRVNPENDKYTRVHTTGSSVVDYICTGIDDLNKCKYFNVHLVTDLMNKYNLQSNKIPDHSVVEMHFMLNCICTTDVSDNNIEFVDESRNYIMNKGDTYRYLNCNNGRKMPINFLESETARLAIVECIEIISITRAEQDEIDNMYDNFCGVYYNEIDKWFGNNLNRNCSRRKFRNATKPYWNENLKLLWNDMRKAENEYLKSPQKTAIRRQTFQIFKEKQSIFDKVYSKEKRKYHREKLIKIETFNTENPRQFWNEIKKLGPNRKVNIPIEAYNESGDITTDASAVYAKWNGHFQNLLKGYNKNDFDRTYYDNVAQSIPELERNVPVDPNLNAPFLPHEIATSLRKAKLNKAVGIDNLCYEILKNEQTCAILTDLFNKLFTSNLIPSVWRKTILKPIPKNPTINPRIPAQYRGIALLSTIYKLFTSTVNSRLTKFLEVRKLIQEEQNGFRAGRSCAEHIFVLNTIIRNRLLANKDTFIAFLDAEKAFDRIDRTLLMHKILKLGISGNIYNIIKTIYRETTCCIKINDVLTDWFASASGVLQGDTLSPTLFNIFANDLIHDVTNLNKGISVGDHNISILLYADDIAVLSENEENLQNVLDVIYNWSHRNMIKFNEKKSNVVHFRKKGKEKSNFRFSLGEQYIETIGEYKYLGLILNEYHDYNITAKILADSANRALGSVINKYRSNLGLGYHTYSKLYTSGICPILDYCSETWGFKNIQSIDAIQNKAQRIFMGVHRFAPLAAINGDMGWTQSQIRRHVSMFRFWNRLMTMDPYRLPKIVLNWDLSLNAKTWSHDMQNLMQECDILHMFDNREKVDLNSIKTILHEKASKNWKDELEKKPKLRSYKQIKTHYQAEPYVLSFMNKKKRSIISQLRCGILPLQIETGRWSNVSLEQRICKLCASGHIENEFHFLFDCCFYEVLRGKFYDEMLALYPNFLSLTDVEKLIVCMKKTCVNIFGDYVCKSFDCRQRHMFMS